MRKITPLNKLVAVVIFSILLATQFLGLQAPAQAAEPIVTTEFAANDLGLWSQSSIYGQNFMGSKKLEDWKQLNCIGWEDLTCADHDALHADLILAPCLSESDRACLDTVEVMNSKNELEKLTFYGESNSQKIAAYKFKDGNEIVDVPKGGGLSVWKSSELSNDGSEKFYATHILLRYISLCVRSSSGTSCSIKLSDFKGSVYPVSVKAGTSCPQFALEGKCVDSLDFKGSERIAVTLRLDQKLTGWIFGRMQNADFSITPLDTKYNKIRIEGDVTLVPELTASVPKSEISKDPILENYLRSFFIDVTRPGLGFWEWGGAVGMGPKTYSDFLSTPTSTTLHPINFDRFNLFSAFEKHLKPYSPPAVFNPRNILLKTNSIFWNFGASAYIGNNACSADKSKLHGMVVTNAPIFEKGPPEFKEGSLNYRVAGVHRNLDGSLFQGRYTYIVRSDTARCYYGFSDAPIVASVEVISADNSTQVATVLVSENRATGFIKLQADNFTFSAPTIKVKLSQAKPLGNAPSQAAKPSVVAAKKVISISCVKGKITKVITAQSPKCPTGYRKK